MAETVEDVLSRRTRATFLNAQAALDATKKVAALMKKTLKKIAISIRILFKNI